MSSLVSALDNINNIQYGENCHIEYNWSEVEQECICQLYFQLVRTNNCSTIKRLRRIYREIYEKGGKKVKVLMLKMLANTRDIDGGKGEYSLSLELLDELMCIDNKVGIEMLKLFIGFKTEGKPFGSWKDLKYFMNIRKKKDFGGYEMYVDQMTYDIVRNNNSLVWKWVPREKSNKFGWIYEEIAKNYFNEYGKYNWNKKALNKAKMNLRELISNKNREIETVQIKQCVNDWKSIDFNKVTSVTMMKQKKSFLNDKNIEKQDRIDCKKNLLNYIEDVKSGKKELKGRNVGMVNYVKEALYCNNSSEKDIINEQWKNNSKSTNKLGEMIAMVDVSGSMESDEMKPLLSAIGLGCRVAEKSKLGKRVLTFSSNPTWVNLENINNFVDMVKQIREIEWGMNTSFHKAMNLILDTIIELKIDATEIENLTLVVFSDMQFDSACSDDNDTSNIINKNTVGKILERKYNDAGIKICGKPYKVPKIVFWNLRSSSGFPILSYHEGYAMMSGYSANALNEFSEEGVLGLEAFTPWNMLLKTLNKDKYNKINELIIDNDSNVNRIV
tara:strand:- start:309 stop:1979 length:1671 start_codon:yes stop_codon:yes gene_type:complete